MSEFYFLRLNNAKDLLCDLMAISIVDCNENFQFFSIMASFWFALWLVVAGENRQLVLVNNTLRVVQEKNSLLPPNIDLSELWKVFLISDFEISNLLKLKPVCCLMWITQLFKEKKNRRKALRSDDCQSLIYFLNLKSQLEITRGSFR